VFSEGTNLQIKALNMKTKVSSDKDLDPSIDGSVISYRGTGGYISSVRVDGNEVCKFNAPDTKLNIVLLDQ
jgi:hypothetical protein